MLLSFDLDGVICNGDSNILGILHDKLRDGRENSLTILKHYYLSRQMILDPHDFSMEGDEIHIITGRAMLTHEWTKRWVLRWLTDAVLHFSATDDTEHLFGEGDYDKASKAMGHNKIDILKEIGADIHFDNNPFIVEEIRKAGIPAILIGRQLI